MSKHWKPDRLAVQQRPSRIRREPVRLQSEAELKQAEIVSREREIWRGVTGISLIAVALAVLMVGISIATYRQYDPAAAAAANRFGQCYNSDGPNCVLDAGTIYVDRQKVRVAGMDVPQIQGAKCDAERHRGIDAALRLADLLNGGKVTVGAPFRDSVSGREVQKVTVDGEDVAPALIADDLARRVGDDEGWCD